MKQLAAYVISTCATAFVIISYFSQPVVAMQLLSIVPFDMHSNTYVSGFEIHTWNIRVRSVCKVPIGWVIKAGKDISPLGELVGSASGFMANLNFRQVNKDHDLDDLFLIDDFSPHQQSATEPSTFIGKISIGEYERGKPAQDRVDRLTDRNIHLTPAIRCPDVTSK